LDLIHPVFLKMFYIQLTYNTPKSIYMFLIMVERCGYAPLPER
jgi:hypothetical protein